MDWTIRPRLPGQLGKMVSVVMRSAERRCDNADRDARKTPEKWRKTRFSYISVAYKE
jgi:hypothetical protein